MPVVQEEIIRPGLASPSLADSVTVSQEMRERLALLKMVAARWAAVAADTGEFIADLADAPLLQKGMSHAGRFAEERNKAAVKVLKGTKNTSHLRILTWVMRSPGDLGVTAAECLKGTRDPIITNALIRSLRNGSTYVQERAISALSGNPQEAAQNALCKTLKSGSPNQRLLAASALSGSTDPHAHCLLVTSMERGQQMRYGEGAYSLVFNPGYNNHTLRTVAFNSLLACAGSQEPREVDHVRELAAGSLKRAWTRFQTLVALQQSADARALASDDASHLVCRGAPWNEIRDLICKDLELLKGTVNSEHLRLVAKVGDSTKDGRISLAAYDLIAAAGSSATELMVHALKHNEPRVRSIAYRFFHGTSHSGAREVLFENLRTYVDNGFPAALALVATADVNVYRRLIDMERAPHYCFGDRPTGPMRAALILAASYGESRKVLEKALALARPIANAPQLPAYRIEFSRPDPEYLCSLPRRLHLTDRDSSGNAQANSPCMPLPSVSADRLLSNCLPGPTPGLDNVLPAGMLPSPETFMETGFEFFEMLEGNALGVRGRLPKGWSLRPAVLKDANDFDFEMFDEQNISRGTVCCRERSIVFPHMKLWSKEEGLRRKDPTIRATA